MSPKKKAVKKKVRKSTTSKKQTPKKQAPKKQVRRTGTASKKPVRANSATSKARIASKPPRRTRPDREIESGDLQGISRRERADSESVDELLEEGNAFEAGIVEGVERADDSEGQEVHTREVPEDDVPEEYLDEE
jgi:hypothetical protein